MDSEQAPATARPLTVRAGTTYRPVATSTSSWKKTAILVRLAASRVRHGPRDCTQSTDEPREDRPDAGCSECSVSDALLFHRAGWVRFTVKAMAILQSLLSFVLAFLFALAVRRKFQIS